MYVRSMARCISWSARGGKSGSNFCKTKGILKRKVCVPIVIIYSFIVQLYIIFITR